MIASVTGAAAAAATASLNCARGNPYQTRRVFVKLAARTRQLTLADAAERSVLLVHALPSSGARSNDEFVVLRRDRFKSAFLPSSAKRYHGSRAPASDRLGVGLKQTESYLFARKLRLRQLLT